jgi:hypothetical protein
MSTMRELSFLAVPGYITTDDACANTITISADSQLTAGLQHNLAIWALPFASDAPTQSQYLGLATPLSSPLVAGTDLTTAQISALGADPSVAYTYQVLAAPLPPTPAEPGDATNAAQLANQVAVVLPTSLWNSAAGQLQLLFANLSSDLAVEQQQLTELINQYANSPADQARFISQLQSVNQQAISLGLMDSTGVIQQNVIGLVLELPDLYASPGSIFLQASGGGGAVTVGGQTFSGGPAPSNLTAYADANIAVNNSAPLILALGDVQIGAADVVATVNGAYTVFSPGGIYVNGAGGVSGAAISQIQTPVTSVTIEQNPLENIILPGAPEPPLSPDLYVLGTISNPTGSVTLTNTVGSILVSGTVNGDPVTISSAGNFMLNSDTWFHTGVDPATALSSNALQAQVLSTGSPSSLTQTNQQVSEAIGQATGNTTGSILSRGSISIDALYLDINGLIQAGLPDIAMLVAADFAPTSSSNLVNGAGNPINGISFSSAAGSALPLAGYVNAASQTITLYDIPSSGGDITLTGQILSTGNGQVVAFQGQPQFSFTNNSTWTLQLGQIDMNRPGKEQRSEYALQQRRI